MDEAERFEELLNAYPKLEEIFEHHADWAELRRLIFKPSPPSPTRAGVSPLAGQAPPTQQHKHTSDVDPFLDTIARSLGEMEVCLCICQEDGVKYVSPAFARLTGYTADEIIGSGPESLLLSYRPEDHALLARIVRSRFLGKPPTEFSMWQIRRKDGSLVHCLGSGLATKHDGRNTLVLVCFDIHERVETQVRLQSTLEATIQAMARVVETRDPYTAGHQKRAAKLACAIANRMGIPEGKTAGVRMAGVIHDLGKLRVPADILTNPGRLTESEFNIIKTHPQVAYDILKDIDFTWPVADIVYQHHERFDGSGYPQGLAGEDILMEARILGVADVVEAMASHRPYRPALGIDTALEEISSGKGTRYAPEPAEACLEVFTDGEFSFEG